jgi:Flp pilus assembly pilin Flp
MKMKKMRKGQTMVEYILIVSLIAIAVIAAIKVFSGKISDKFEEAGDAIEEAGN